MTGRMGNGRVCAGAFELLIDGVLRCSSSLSADFVGPLEITRVQMGSCAPSVELLDMTDPLDVFYLQQPQPEQLKEQEQPFAAGLARTASPTRQFAENANSFSAGHQHQQNHARLSSGLSSAGERLSSDVLLDDLGFQQHPASAQISPVTVLPRSPLDTQISMKFEYDAVVAGGDGFYITGRTQLRLNVPTPGFMVLPIEFTVSQLQIRGILFACLYKKVLFT